MSDTRGLLDRISAFRKRLDTTAPAIPEAIPIDGPVAPMPFAHAPALSPNWEHAPNSGALPRLTDRAQQLLTRAKQLLDRHKAFTNDALFVGLSSDVDSTDTLPGYHRETLATIDLVVRTVHSFPNSASVQLKLCVGLEGLLSVVSDRLAIQDRALARRRIDFDRIDRLAQILSAISSNQPATLQQIATLAEELLHDARQGKPIRFVAADVASVRAYQGAQELSAGVRHIAVHAINAAQVVARIVPFDYEWAGRPLLPVVSSLLMDLGMLAVPAAVLAKADQLTDDDRRAIEAHPKYGAELLLWRFPTVAGPIAAAVATHHERGDGTGYPNGLRGGDIPALGRLLRVADVYAALNEHRPHRPTSDPRAALTEVLLMAEQGEVDRDFAEYLLNLAFYPAGAVVELTDGRTGLVVANHANRLDPRSPARPIVAVLANADGTLLPRAEYIDLTSAEHGGIVRGVSPARARELLGPKYPDLV